MCICVCICANNMQILGFGGWGGLGVGGDTIGGGWGGCGGPGTGLIYTHNTCDDFLQYHPSFGQPKNLEDHPVEDHGGRVCPKIGSKTSGKDCNLLGYQYPNMLGPLGYNRSYLWYW